jgi:hypothetical protein
MTIQRRASSGMLMLALLSNSVYITRIMIIRPCMVFNSQRVLLEDEHERDFIVDVAREQGMGLLAGRLSLIGYFPKVRSMTDQQLCMIAGAIAEEDRNLAALEPPQELPEFLGEMHATISTFLAEKVGTSAVAAAPHPELG